MRPETWYEKLQATLNGWKTYLVAIASIIGVAVAWGSGEMGATAAVQSIVALVMGMTMRAAVSKSGPAKMMLIPLALGLMLSAGCQPTEMTPAQRFECEKADVLSARHGFDATATVVVTMIESGQFTPSQTRQVRIWMRTGFNVLNAWDAAVRSHEPTREIKQRFDSINRDITAAKIAAERRTSYIVRSTAVAA